MTSWVRAGALCVCIDQEWLDLADEEVQGPLLDDVCVVTGHQWFDGEHFIRVLGWSSEFHFAASAFRPLNSEEGDVAYFSTFLKDSSVPTRTLETACSS